MEKNYGVVIPDENLFSAVQKITFSNRAYGFYVETGLGCALVFPDGKTIYGVKFFGERFNEAYAPEDAAYLGFRDGRIYPVDSEWIDLRYVCDEWRCLESMFTRDIWEPILAEKKRFDDAFSRFQKTIFYEPRSHYASFLSAREFVDSVNN